MEAKYKSFKETLNLAYDKNTGISDAVWEGCMPASAYMTFEQYHSYMEKLCNRKLDFGDLT